MKYLENLETTLLKTQPFSICSALRLSLAELRTRTGASIAFLIENLSFTFSRGDLSDPMQYLSENAFQLYLDNTRATTLFGEYVRFRRIIIWCAIKASLIKLDDEVIDDFIPGLPQVIAYLRTSPSSRTDGFDFENLKCLLKEHQRCAAGLLEKMNFGHIHSELLDAVVEPLVTPLKLLSEQRMKEAYKKEYRFQALPRSPIPPQYVWEHGDLHRTDDDGNGNGKGSVLAKSKVGIGLAIYPVPVFQNHGVYEWAIVLEKPCSVFCEIGFTTVKAKWMEDEDGDGANQLTVSANYGHCLKITARTVRTNRGKHCWFDFGNSFEHLNARVKFRLDLNKHACSIAVNNDNYLPAWDDLPSDVVYFPAVCLGKEVGGQVRIQLLRGFGMV